eukprot:553147-Lingulodinium_polyedra.AAC.1
MALGKLSIWMILGYARVAPEERGRVLASTDFGLGVNREQAVLVVLSPTGDGRPTEMTTSPHGGKRRQ